MGVKTPIQILASVSKCRLTYCFIFLLVCTLFYPQESKSYAKYHQLINEAETLASELSFIEALNQYDQVFKHYDFVFVRDYKVAAQLALAINDINKAFLYLEKSIGAGWTLRSIKKNKYLSLLRKKPQWWALKKSYPELRASYLTGIDLDLRKKVHLMFKKDQRKAFGALIKIGARAKENYATQKFAPFSEVQMDELQDILNDYGYPGEKSIGNTYWASTIIGHHNSISQSYVKNDARYTNMQPSLIIALEKGLMSPYEYALIADWRIAVLSNRTDAGYGFLSLPKHETLSLTNELRNKIGLRSIALRNKLVDVGQTTGIDFYLPDWISGKIKIE
jgi:hypothetical protein